MTKGELVTAAMGEIGIAESEFDIPPEAITSGIRRLDTMMAMWSSRGVVVNYPFGDLDGGTESGIPDTAREAVITNLAVRLASSYGKQPSALLLGVAKESRTTLFAFSARPGERQFAPYPRGAGHKTTDFPFNASPEDPYVDTVDNDVDLSGGPDGGT